MDDRSQYDWRSGSLLLKAPLRALPTAEPRDASGKKHAANVRCSGVEASSVIHPDRVTQGSLAGAEASSGDGVVFRQNLSAGSEIRTNVEDGVRVQADVKEIFVVDLGDAEVNRMSSAEETPR